MKKHINKIFCSNTKHVVTKRISLKSKFSAIRWYRKKTTIFLLSALKYSTICKVSFEIYRGKLHSNRKSIWNILKLKTELRVIFNKSNIRNEKNIGEIDRIVHKCRIFTKYEICSIDIN